MLNIKIICVGKLGEKFLKDASKEYEKRISGYCKLEIIEISEYKLPEKPSENQILSALEKEAELIYSKIPNNCDIISLCIEGKNFSSEQLSKEISNIVVNGTSRLVFIIGGSFGLHQNIKNKSKIKLSMSKMTFPHNLARIMLLEQIYRAFNINYGGKYHK